MKIAVSQPPSLSEIHDVAWRIAACVNKDAAVKAGLGVNFRRSELQSQS